MDFRVVKEEVTIIFAHALFNIFFRVFKAWEMTSKVILPEVKLTVFAVVESNHAELVSRSHSTSQKLQCNRWARGFCHTLEVLASF